MLNKLTFNIYYTRHLWRCLSTTNVQREPLVDEIMNKIKTAKGEIKDRELGNPPREDKGPAPKKEEAPH